MTATVFFTPELSAKALLKIYQSLGVAQTAPVAVKISTGEPGGHNYLQPALIADLVHELGATIVECNTAYGGRRQETADHWQAIKEHGFLGVAPVDILDEEGEKRIPVSGGKHLTHDIIGSHFDRYESFVNLAHFKGHAMGGFGGVLKNQSIGFASTAGKALIHSAGSMTDAAAVWSNLPAQDAFLESMAEAAKAVADYVAAGDKSIVYIDVMNNLSVDCDCDSNPEAPCMQDIGILASLDPVALDQACIDKIWTSDDPGRDHFIERVERQHGRHILEYAESIGLGQREYTITQI